MTTTRVITVRRDLQAAVQGQVEEFRCQLAAIFYSALISSFFYVSISYFLSISCQLSVVSCQLSVVSCQKPRAGEEPRYLLMGHY